ncbi:phosphate propanoyltransferase [Enterococcus avium]|uniref:phosphate propanoyltransferase n=1 Tax=Enterococcus avium TaxID=33945 RepID=UPI001A96E1B1|nr:phosphate propanoyltransferase [Enterococcus avium]MBO1139573.1 phosphate propanoyltransferase [Enterococcus avium]MDT2479489.1 phosphate propanoyltransferase [Enterococcus avium]
MEDYEVILNAIMAHLNPEDVPNDDLIPVGISNRHIHLSQAALDKLFGNHYQLTKLKDLSQPGQYACKECVTLAGPKGVIEKVRILGPVRAETQVEILQSDTFKLGVKGALRLSGDLNGTPGLTLIGPNGAFEMAKGVIIAKRHIHMLPEEAERFGVTDGQVVTIDFAGERGGSLNNVVIRATANSGLECHIDTEEANALGVTPGTTIKIRN